MRAPSGLELEALCDRIETMLRDSLDEQRAEVLEQWSGAAPSEREAVRAYVAERRDRMLDSLRVIDSVEELKWSGLRPRKHGSRSVR
jgi:hypothetical protein